MAELVTLRQQRSVDYYHDQFVSILTQLHLPKPYALSIFVRNLKVEIRKYLQLFRHRTMVEAFHIAKQVEDILETTRRDFLSREYTMSKYNTPHIIPLGFLVLQIVVL